MDRLSVRRNSKKAFTLVEILIVVIILGILAAIVIPQFTNASQDARKSSLVSQLQTVRSQVSLYALQHQDKFPTKLITGGANAWDNMTTKTNIVDTDTTGTPALGPYLQAPPVNNLNNLSTVTVVAVDPTFTANDPVSSTRAGTCAAGGWVFSTASGKIWATAKKSTNIYDEGGDATAAAWNDAP